jgi:hypothetical protein
VEMGICGGPELEGGAELAGVLDVRTVRKSDCARTELCFKNP